MSHCTRSGIILVSCKSIIKENKNSHSEMELIIFYASSQHRFDDAVHPLYNGTHFNSKILCNVILIGTEWFISSPEHEVLMVSYCGQSMSVVRRQQFVLKANSS